jgi:hypothetical protein
MSFLNPLLLLGLAGISIPIIIHLLNRRRVIPMKWAAMRFLRVAIEQNQRRLQLEDRLLLLLRCLLLAILALALARPALRATRTGSLFGKSPVTAVICLDTSASLQHSDGVQTRFAKAQTAAEQILDTLPAGSAVALLFVADNVRAVIPEPTRDINLVRRMIREAMPTSRATDHQPGIERAMRILETLAEPNRELYLVTDHQAAGWRNNFSFLHKPGIRSTLIFVGQSEDAPNLAVTDLRLVAGFAPVRQSLRFEAQVTNFGRQDAADVRVSLALDNEAPAEDALIESLPAGTAKTVSLFGKFRTEGVHTVTARIPADRLPADDFRTIALPAVQSVRVLLVDGAPGLLPRDSATFYLRNALQPVPASELDRHFIKVTTAPLDTSRLDDYDVVILADVAEFNPAPLEPYLKRGGGLIIFTGPHVKASFYNKLPFLPATLGAVGAPRPTAPPVGRADPSPPSADAANLQSRDYDHPIVSLWNDPAAGTLASARFNRWFSLKPNDARVVLKLADGTPVMAERNRVVLFGSTANTEWNDLAARPAFVPLVQRLLGFVLQQQNADVAVGEMFTQRTDAWALGKEVQVERPDKQRASVRVELLDGAPGFQFAETDRSGAYVATIATEPPTTLTFAAQPFPRESDLTALTTSQLDQLRRVASVIQITPDQPVRAQLERVRYGEEWSPHLLILALLLAVMETGLAQWFSRSK